MKHEPGKILRMTVFPSRFGRTSILTIRDYRPLVAKLPREECDRFLCRFIELLAEAERRRRDTDTDLVAGQDG
jgi:hypothetical protein